jgi:hypothetical protein
MKRLQRLLAFVLSLSLINVGMLQSAHAGLIPTEEVAGALAAGQSGPGHARLVAALARDEVRSEMVRLGVDQALAVDRVAALTDEEAARLADQIDSAPAGSGIVGALLLVFFVLLFTDLLGWTKVFPFTRTIR